MIRKTPKLPVFKYIYFWSVCEMIHNIWWEVYQYFMQKTSMYVEMYDCYDIIFGSDLSNFTCIKFLYEQN